MNRTTGGRGGDPDLPQQETRFIGSFHINRIYDSLSSLKSIKDTIISENVQGLSIDAPLIINNISGQRSCKRELSQVYGARKASCHASNTTLYQMQPAPSSPIIYRKLILTILESLKMNIGRLNATHIPKNAFLNNSAFNIYFIRQ